MVCQVAASVLPNRPTLPRLLTRDTELLFQASPMTLSAPDAFLLTWVIEDKLLEVALVLGLFFE